jgi:heptosyltransferase-2
MAIHPASTAAFSHRILVRGVNWLGDAVMTTPALLRLRERFPDAHIALLAPNKLVDLWASHPAVDEVAGFSADETVFAVARKLRARTFDLALVLPNSPRSALEIFLAKIPDRVGYARPWRNFFLTEAVASPAQAVKMRKRGAGEIRSLVAAGAAAKPDLNSRVLTNTATATGVHQIHEYLHLVAALGANPEPLPPQLFVTPAETEAARKKFGLDKINGTICGLNPGAEYGPAKRWPVDRFIAAAQQIQTQHDCVWLLFGGKNDAEITGRIAAALHASRITHHDLAGKTTLRELMALLKACGALLTNDTGPMHVAAALGTPVVAPFGSTSPELTGPGLPGDRRHFLIRSNVPCSPCFLRECPIDFRCMNGIEVELLVKAVVETLRR